MARPSSARVKRVRSRTPRDWKSVRKRTAVPRGAAGVKEKAAPRSQPAAKAAKATRKGTAKHPAHATGRTPRPAVPKAKTKGRSTSAAKSPSAFEPLRLPEGVLLGAHTSTAGGVAQAVARAQACGFTAAQIFVKNNKQWFAPPLGEEEARPSARRGRTRASISSRTIPTWSISPARTRRCSTPRSAP